MLLAPPADCRPPRLPFMDSTLDLAAYRNRIGWHAAARADHATLAALLAAHMRTIPFENLDVLLGRGVSLDLGALQAKLVAARRGGYCFEHATLFAAVLDALGFVARRHIARVIVVTPREMAPRTHAFLTVDIDGARYVVDPGFGSLAPAAPLPLVDGARVRVGDDEHWMARDGQSWKLVTRSDGDLIDCWISPLEDDPGVDFEMGNHFTATWPASAFVNRLLMRALTSDGRVSLMNRDLTVRRGAVIERRVVTDRAELRALIAGHFGFDLPDVERLRVPGVPEWA
jgi:N-hydroxyarylamine O-acetyltransferase